MALATYQSFYPVMLLVPLCLMLLPEVQKIRLNGTAEIKEALKIQIDMYSGVHNSPPQADFST